VAIVLLERATEPSPCALPDHIMLIFLEDFESLWFLEATGFSKVTLAGAGEVASGVFQFRG
jgi:hypothetical protein